MPASAFRRGGPANQGRRREGTLGSAGRRPAPRSRSEPSAEGVDANAGKEHFYEVAKRLDIKGRTAMSK
jgi:hypothetical protein